MHQHVYVKHVTQAQVDKVKSFNERTPSAKPVQLGHGHDAVEVVDDDDKRAAMVCIHWCNMTIGILPDGSSHS
jgi:hypothetical protein